MRLFIQKSSKSIGMVKVGNSKEELHFSHQTKKLIRILMTRLKHSIKDFLSKRLMIRTSMSKWLQHKY